MDMYNKSTTTNQDTTMKVRQATITAKYLAAKDLVAAKDLAFSNENRDALLAYYKNSLPPRILSHN